MHLNQCNGVILHANGDAMILALATCEQCKAIMFFIFLYRVITCTGVMLLPPPPQNACPDDWHLSIKEIPQTPANK
jgi:hypothetical protein